MQDLRRVQRVLKDHGGRQQLRQKDSEKLSKDMAQWQQVQETQRMKDALVAKVLADLALQRLEVGQNVAMGDDYTARLGSRARGKDDLHDVVARERRRSNGLIGVRRNLLAQGFQVDVRDARDVVLH